jgi:pimeloyl-ACP methyl ester carboxylesterase
VIVSFAATQSGSGKRSDGFALAEEKTASRSKEGSIDTLSASAYHCGDMQPASAPRPTSAGARRAPEQCAQAPSRVVVLVHGTFAREAEWIRPSSQFSVSLASSLGYGTEVRSFRWSGANSHSARLQAAEELRVFLHESLDSFPSSRHFLLAHSHGGNVVLYALRDLELKERIAGVVCMSTPFLNCSARSWTGWLPKAAVLTFFAVLMLLLVCGIVPLLENESFLAFGSALPIWLQAPLALCVLAAPLLLIEAAGFLWSKIFNEAIPGLLGARQKLRVEALSQALTEAPPTLCTVIRLDEARLWLRWIGHFSEIPDVFLMRIAGALTRWLIALWLISGLAMVTLMKKASEDALENARVIWAVVPVLVLFGGAAVLLILPILSIVTSKVLRGQSFSYGEALFDNLVLKVEAGKLPTGISPSAELHEFRYREIEMRGGGLRHSLVYQSPVVVRQIAEWMLKTECEERQKCRRAGLGS